MSINVLQDLRVDKDVIGDFFYYIDSTSDLSDVDVERRSQKDETYFYIIQVSYKHNFFQVFNDWVKEISPYYERLVSETRYDCLADEGWWFDYLTESNWGYSDEWMFCSECGKAINYNPTSGRIDNYWIREDIDILCEDCIRENAEEYIKDQLIVNWEHGVPDTNIPLNTVFSKTELIEFGFKLVWDNLEIGMYGTYHDPRVLLQKLTEENHNTNYICHCTDQNPFATYYEIWAKEREESE